MGRLDEELKAFLLGCLAEDMDLEQLLSSLRDYFNCDIIIYDHYYRAVKAAVRDNARGAVREAVRRGRIPDNELEGFENDLKELVDSDEKAVVFRIDQLTIALAKIFKGSDLAGILFCSFEADVPDTVLKECSICIADIVTYLGTGDRTEEADEGNYIYDIISRELLIYDKNTEVGLSNVLRKGASKSGISWMMNPCYAIVSIKPVTAESGGNDICPIRREFIRNFPGVYSLVRREQLLAIFCGLEPGPGGPDRTLNGRIEQFLIKYNSCAVISSVFDALENRRNYRRQAMDAMVLDYGSLGTGDILYADKVYTRLMLAPAVSRYGNSIFILGEIRKLMDYDRARGSRYTETLWQYLRHGRKSLKAAEALYIDRSTLSYRLKRISSIIGRSPEEPEYARLLLMALAVIFEGGKPVSFQN